MTGSSPCLVVVVRAWWFRWDEFKWDKFRWDKFGWDTFGWDKFGWDMNLIDFNGKIENCPILTGSGPCLVVIVRAWW